METRGLDALLVTGPVNVRYLTGGYRSTFFETKKEIGLGAYGPAVLYRRGYPERSRFLASPLDRDQLLDDPVWISDVDAGSWTGASTPPLITDWVEREGLAYGTIGVELPFVSAEIYLELRNRLPEVNWLDAVTTLEHLRAVKRPHELELMRVASERIVEAMQHGFRELRPGMSSSELADLVAAKERELGLSFDYCLVAFGSDTNRTPHARRVFRPGSIASFDSGANIEGYIGDLCRVGCHGDPDALQRSLLEQIDHVQLAARRPMRAGALGGEIVEAATAAVAECDHGSWMTFVAHGVGLVSHEAPRIVANSIPYPTEHAEQPLEAGMVVSIETTIARPECGYLKLEDTVAVTATGCQGFGDTGRGWNPIGPDTRTLDPATEPRRETR